MSRRLLQTCVLSLALPCATSLGQAPGCPADWNRNCLVSAQDIFDFLTDYFGPTSQADINHDGVKSVQDIFDYLGSYFSGCDPCPPGRFRMIVFGDSLSDVGRHFSMYGDPAAPNYLGRYSDGPIWVEFLATGLGIASADVRNYAVGGAASGHNNCCTPGAPGLLDEIDEFGRDAAAGNGAASDALYVLWIGANDFETWQRTGALQSQPPNVLIDSAISNIATAVRTLGNHGARRILIGNLPDLGRIPKITVQNDPAQAALATTGTIIFNANLRWELSRLEQSLGVDIVLLDVNSLFEAIQSNPAAAGFTDATTACYPPGATTPCPSPSTHVFWDNVHPSSAAHRLLVPAALAALADGGAPLPATACDFTNARVQFATPSGLFATGATFTVRGTVNTDGTSGASLMINGVPTEISAAGEFEANIPLAAQQLETPIVAELQLGGRVVDRARIVVLQGPSIGAGQILPNAVLASINESAIGPIQDEVIHQLLQDGYIDLWPHVRDPVPGFKPGGAGPCDVGYLFTPTGVSYSCATANLEMRNGSIRARFQLQDVYLPFHISLWLTNCPDPGFECDGAVSLSNLGVYIDLRVAPSATGAPGEVRVTALSDLQLDPIYTRWIDVFGCDPDFGGISTLLIEGDAVPTIARKVQEAIDGFLRDNGNGTAIARTIEGILASASISRPIGETIGVTPAADIQSINLQTDQASMWFENGFVGPVPTATRTIAVPRTAHPHPANDPVDGGPYHAAISISLESLNQFLLARSDVVLRPYEVSSLSLGGTPFPVTAGLISSFIPSMHTIPSDTPYVIRVIPSSPPMFTGRANSDCDGFEVVLPEIRFEITRAGVASTTPDVAFSLDLRACVSLEIDHSRGELRPRLSFPTEGVSPPVITENRVCADEATLVRLITSLTGLLAAKIGDAIQPFPIPELAGIQPELRHAVLESGYAVFYLNLSTQNARPDLAVVEIDMPSAIDMNFPFDVRFRVQNVGGATAAFGAWMGASLSADAVFANGNDVGIGQQFFNLAQSPLHPGQSRWFTLSGLHAPAGIPPNQVLFVLADVPQSIGGGGMLCESDERNNYRSVPLLAKGPDAFVVQVVPPQGLLSIPSPGLYQVTVGRNEVGLNTMNIPFTVTVGAAPNGTTASGTAYNVPRGGQVTVPFYVGTPIYAGSCGESRNFTVTACSTLADSNASNNCAAATVPIAAPYCDLEFSFDVDDDGDSDAPRSARRCNQVDWTVRVTNVGNRRTPMSVCAKTGITRYSGEGNWNASLGLNDFSIPPLDPGQSYLHRVRDYSVGFQPNCGGVYTGTQYIKAMIKYESGCFDPAPNGQPNYCPSSNNFSQSSIRIDP